MAATTFLLDFRTTRGERLCSGRIEAADRVDAIVVADEAVNSPDAVAGTHVVHITDESTGDLFTSVERA
jgi:hypothetical protein